MKRFSVRITPYAYEQILEIHDYIAIDLINPQAAADFLSRIQTATEKLSQLPTRIKTVDEEPWGQEGVRKIIVKNFYIYFWIDEDNSVVHIIAVSFGKRDQKEMLKNMGE